MRIAVVVVGDLGRSPRMQYHARAIALQGNDVDLVGLAGAPLHAVVAAEPRVHPHRIPDGAFSSRLSGGRGRFVVLSAVRAATQAFRLAALLLRLPRPDVIVVQNPPAVPTLVVAWMAARLRGARFVIDWHNLAHTILAVRLGERHRAVRALARSERRWGHRADAHFAVSQALADWLAREWNIRATVLYDRPPASFVAPTAAAADDLWARLANTLNLPATRPPLIVCPTSWTPDEDFDLLLEALERADRALEAPASALRATAGKPAAPAAPAAPVAPVAPVAPAAPAPNAPNAPNAPSAPALALLLTGRGELRDAFEARLARRSLVRIAVRTVWLEPGDYPTLIGMADAGLCLHQSSSGLDLPMKLSDFRGAGVPVCAFDYGPVLAEVLTAGHEGVVFAEPGQLAAVLTAFATRNPAAAPAVYAARQWLAEHPAERWEDHWSARVAGTSLAGSTPQVR